MRKKVIVCKDTGETAYSYQEYLLTTHWRNKRKLVATMADYRCEICKKKITSGFHIHHLSYKHIGNEQTKELMFLCPDCHTAIHSKKSEKPMIQEKELKAIPKKRKSVYKAINEKKSVVQKVKKIMNSDKKIQGMFIKHFYAFMKELKEYEKGK